MTEGLSPETRLPEPSSRNIRVFDQLKTACWDHGQTKVDCSRLITCLDFFRGLHVLGDSIFQRGEPLPTLEEQASISYFIQPMAHSLEELRLRGNIAGYNRSEGLLPAFHQLAQHVHLPNLERLPISSGAIVIQELELFVHRHLSKITLIEFWDVLLRAGGWQRFVSNLSTLEPSKVLKFAIYVP